MSCDVSSYACSDKGLLMPFVNEYTWYKEVRIIVYLVGLIWSFVGLSIAADVFMTAIEKITSKTKRLKLPHPDLEGEFTEEDIKVWNGTVANLTLMALGSSAPQILLNILEVFKLSFFAGDLGPSTIVGSAAFNLLCISGVCLMSISSPEVRRIHIFRVFVLTAVFSVLAYVWLIIVLVVITPDYIDLWEAVVTFLLFPFLVVLAYLLDKNYCGKRPVGDESVIGFGEENVLEKEHADKQVIVEVLRRLKSKKNIDENDVAQLTSHLMEQNKSHDRGWYRINAIRNMTGSQSLQTPMNKRTNELLEVLLVEDVVGETDDFLEMTERGSKAVIEFSATSTAVLEKDGRGKVNIMRHGNLEKRVLFKVETFDGTAEKDADYKPIKETLVFEPHETSKSVEIEIIDDDVWEPDEIFFLRLSVDNDQPANCGKRQITSVVILNDDDPGTFQFPKPSYLFKESAGTALIPVNREFGADGEVNVKWKTNDISAVGGRDFENTSGELVFKHGETTKMIEILLKDDKEFEKDENFEIELLSATTGGKIGNRKRCVVTIVNDDEFDGFVCRIADLTNAN
ncbi:hypothetical protein KUTeg_002853 [Tegillarca granosa]|uniref:Calx-beta domain-containing protein n=1 Tax=Tegillarca granosa TaxID=220873 RepID=A0ABQ9FQS1_TEGGR|nr:hypothetical protein KUTeg_002853 [Tegillarca granosa]